MRKRHPDPRKGSSADLPFPLSNGEVHFLWWFIDGAIMSPPTRQALRDGWGMCDRHAWAFLSVEAAYRQGYMHGPAVLYEDLMSRARASFDLCGPMQTWRVVRNVRARGPCHMCEMNYGPNSAGKMDEERFRIGRNPAALRTLALRTARYWRKALCGRCAGNDSPQRCRKHLIEGISQGAITDLSPHISLVNSIAGQAELYARSFRFGYHETRTDEGLAALLSAVGWCSGWRTLLSIAG
jgi:hypothetical protein